MTKEQSFGASSNRVSDWQVIDWPNVRPEVRRLQLRIAKAIRAEKHGTAKALSWLLTHSHSAKLLAVKRVTGNKGAKTPGVDNKLWRTDRQKYAAVQDLKRRGYRPLPLRRHYIPKKNGKLRPLSIPTMCGTAPCKRSTRWLSNPLRKQSVTATPTGLEKAAPAPTPLANAFVHWPKATRRSGCSKATSKAASTG